MKRRAALLAVLAVPAAAQQPEPLDGARLLRVREGSRQPLFTNFEQGCPAPTARCRTGAYLVGGDLVVADAPAERGFVAVRFTNSRGRTTAGHLPKAALEPAPAKPMDGWTGAWRATEQHIRIARAAGGGLRVEGNATWGGLDPERVRRGGVNLGAFAGTIDGRGGAATVTDDGCRVRLRLLGPYLLASDNLRCGGMNVTFNGVYRRVH